MLQADLIRLLYDPLIGTILVVLGSLIIGRILSALAGEAKATPGIDGVPRIGYSKIRILAALVSLNYIGTSMINLFTIIFSMHFFNFINFFVAFFMSITLFTINMVFSLLPFIGNKTVGKLNLIIYCIATGILTFFMAFATTPTPLGLVGPPTLLYAPGFIIGFFLMTRHEEATPPSTPIPFTRPVYPPPPMPPPTPDLPSKGIAGDEASYCSFCGAELPPNAITCPSCGAQNMNSN